MAELNYKLLKDHLIEKQFSPVYLIYGEEFLYKQVLEELLNAMLSPKQRMLTYEPMDGGNENVTDAIERLNTFSLLSGPRIIALCDSRIFYSQQDEKHLVEKVKTAYDNGDVSKAVTHFVTLLRVLNLSVDDIHGPNRDRISRMADENASAEWLDDILDMCRRQKVTVSLEQTAADVLYQAIEKGFPENNRLIVTAEVVDKRKKLFKIIQKIGTIIDCSVPKGDRRADRTTQEAVLRDHLNQVLAENQKIINRAAFLALMDMTGFELYGFSGNLEKLIDYIGDRMEITVDDVHAVLKRTRQDPVYALTSAVSDRNAADALFFLGSLLANEIHPLQILAAITNQIRKLMVIKDFAESRFGKQWRSDCPYGVFQNHVIQDLRRFDDALSAFFLSWEDILSGGKRPDGDSKSVSGRKRKPGKDTDLQVVQSEKNVFPIYQMLKKSENFKKNELIECFGILSDTDVDLKSTGRDAKIILEKAILRICSPTAR